MHRQLHKNADNPANNGQPKVMPATTPQPQQPQASRKVVSAPVAFGLGALDNTLTTLLRVRAFPVLAAQAALNTPLLKANKDYADLVELQGLSGKARLQRARELDKGAVEEADTNALWTGAMGQDSPQSLMARANASSARKGRFTTLAEDNDALNAAVLQAKKNLAGAEKFSNAINNSMEYLWSPVSSIHSAVTGQDRNYTYDIAGQLLSGGFVKAGENMVRNVGKHGVKKGIKKAVEVGARGPVRLGRPAPKPGAVKRIAGALINPVPTVTQAALRGGARNAAAKGAPRMATALNAAANTTKALRYPLTFGIADWLAGKAVPYYMSQEGQAVGDFITDAEKRGHNVSGVIERVNAEYGGNPETFYKPKPDTLNITTLLDAKNRAQAADATYKWLSTILNPNQQPSSNPD